MSARPFDLQPADVTGPRDGVEESLGLKGERTIPNLVDMGGIEFVYNVGAGGFSNWTQSSGVLDGTAINGVSSKTRNLLAPPGYTFGAEAGIVSNLNRNARVLAACLIVSFDAAGAAAFNGKQIAAQYLLRDTTSSAQSYLQEVRNTCMTGQLDYLFPLTPGVLLVPWSCALGAYARSLDATVFPANTTVSTRLTVLLRAKGAEVPK